MRAWSTTRTTTTAPPPTTGGGTSDAAPGFAGKNTPSGHKAENLEVQNDGPGRSVHSLELLEEDRERGEATDL